MWGVTADVEWVAETSSPRFLTQQGPSWLWLPTWACPSQLPLQLRVAMRPRTDQWDVSESHEPSDSNSQPSWVCVSLASVLFAGMWESQDPDQDPTWVQSLEDGRTGGHPPCPRPAPREEQTPAFHSRTSSSCYSS